MYPYKWLYLGVSVPGNGIEVVYALNVTGKKFIFQLIANVQLPGSKGYDKWRLMYSTNPQMLV